MHPGIISIKEDIRNIELNTAELQATGQLKKLIARLDTVISQVIIDLKKQKIRYYATRYKSI